MSFNEFLKRCKSNPWRVDRETISGSPVPVIMGILNVTPDSFFDGGLYKNEDNALKHAIKLLDDGAKIIDIGGESSRPGASCVTAEEEINRVVPVIKKLKPLSGSRSFFISVDTTKAKTAKAALEAGAHIVNDVSMLSDEKMPQVIKDFDASVIINHRRGNFSTMQKDFTPYQDVVKEVRKELLIAAEKLLQIGIPKEKICLDPGIGFGKTAKDNIDLIANAEVLLQDGFALLYGMSRKSYIAKIKGLESSDRLIPSLVFGIFAALGGISILRVHDVKETKETLALLEAFRKDGTIYAI